jgi:hypothetical protein
MRRAGPSLLAIFVLVTAFACPVLEMFDHWDHTAKTGKDTESALVIVALCAGMELTFVRAARPPARVTSRAGHAKVRCAPTQTAGLDPVDFPPESPPLTPLRI